ncbi:MAG: hypothetical protein ACKV1O_00035 [Saprospiraceae bacterium]
MKKEEPFDSTDESIPFKHPILDLYDAYEWNKVMPAFFDRYNSLADERSAVIFFTLVIESELDRIIRLTFPKSEILFNRQGGQGFTFSDKALIVKALHLIPTSIFDFIDITRKIRNEFAHNLDIDNFEELNNLKDGKKLIEKLNDICLKYESALHYTKTKNSYINKFKDIGVFAIKGLSYYKVNLILFREEILKDEFSQRLQKIAKEKKKKQDEEFEENRHKYFAKE